MVLLPRVLACKTVLCQSPGAVQQLICITYVRDTSLYVRHGPAATLIACWQGVISQYFKNTVALLMANGLLQCLLECIKTTAVAALSSKLYPGQPGPPKNTTHLNGAEY
jgi:hypothetical protein